MIKLTGISISLSVGGYREPYKASSVSDVTRLCLACLLTLSFPSVSGPHGMAKRLEDIPRLAPGVQSGQGSLDLRGLLSLKDRQVVFLPLCRDLFSMRAVACLAAVHCNGLK